MRDHDSGGPYVLVGRCGTWAKLRFARGNFSRNSSRMGLHCLPFHRHRRLHQPTGLGLASPQMVYLTVKESEAFGCGFCQL